MPEADPGFTLAGLPFVLEDDPDLRAGGWTKTESMLAARILSDIMALSPKFSRPSGPIGIVPDDDQWNPWVNENVAALIRLQNLAYENLIVVSFKG